MRSISDRTDYKSVCREASENDRAFSTFKNNFSYVAILEHVNTEQGLLYLSYLEKNFPEYINYLDRFKENDKYGSPRTSEYPGIGCISPTTLRYVKVLSDIKELMGDLTGKKIVEIGSGYGGQCFILSQFYQDLDYSLIDMDEVLPLNKKYLDRLKTSHRTISLEEVKDLNEDFDLVISNYAYSEVDKELQNLYWEKVIKRSKNGYFTLNFVSDVFGIKSYNLDEIMSIFSEKNPQLLEENPKTFENNIILYF